MFPERFAQLPPYAFPRLRALLDGHAPGGAPLSMSIGEPRHPMPEWIGPMLAEGAAGFGQYPPNEGAPDLLEAISAWLGRRYGAEVGPGRLTVLNGSREGLFYAALALCPEAKGGARPAVLMPNPFYQVYAVAAAAAGAEAVLVDAEATGLPDFAALPPALLGRTAIAYICSPANPQGAVASMDYLRGLLRLAERHDFRVFADECYSEIWRGAPPVGALEALAAEGADPERLVTFNSLSKRSNAPGLRSGFACAGPASMAAMRQLRSYAGPPVPGPIQAVSARLWADEAHVEASRALYAAKLGAADEILTGLPGYSAPEGGFFLWLPVPGGDGEAAALRLWREAGIRVLPGAYLAREAGGRLPGAGRIRVALVAPEDEVRRGLTALRACLEG